MSADDARRREDAKYFHWGGAHSRGETPERGWRQEQEVPTPGGTYRRMDSSREVDPSDKRFTEYKSGQISGKTSREQADKDIYLVRDQGWSGQWVRVENERFDPDIRQPLEKLARDFPDRFQIVTVTRKQRTQFIELGRQLERDAPQLELFDATQLREQHKARQQAARDARLREQRALDKAPREKERQALERVDLVKKRDTRARVQSEARVADKAQQKTAKSRALERDPEEQARTREDNRDKAKPPVVAKVRADPTPKTKDARERAEANAREMADNIGLNLGNAQAEQVQAILREGRESKDVSREIEPTRSQQPPAPPPAPQRTWEQEREHARALAREAGLSPQIMGILGLNTNNPPKMIDVGQARTQADSERDRSIHQQRERERSERQREGRYRGD
ncbi:hypothetical protein ACQP2U_08390 [Nocardia sp. CA-084685]|uniref:hypothetical protein n=1 Tax=Nocardia sp. CA-084685 TaxID=3239970 RepID=UPI003D99E4A5